MALYLGNQKVSLKSGQDPTFDYGFDSNGRLVFANKNAKEINNFLNYDSSYSEILDLSNLSKMEKVAVNGTVDRKMEGLKGLLVSPNAPFTGSSPQINASYTGLNKSALVSLFESVPYNVGYTKVGNPTIVDGVVSGFSANNYLYLPSTLDTTKNWEFVCKFKNETSRYKSVILGTTSQYGLQISISYGTRFFVFMSSKGSSWNMVNGGYGISNSMTLGNTYYLKLTYSTSEGYKLYLSTDGINWALNYSYSGTSYIYNNNNLTLGKDNSGDYLGGSIYINETYANANVVPWFTGKPAMTKTCSIVGATGTADLTQEDKNIILNKGWSLTVQ